VSAEEVLPSRLPGAGVSVQTNGCVVGQEAAGGSASSGGSQTLRISFDASYVRRRTAESRASQGLPRHVEDSGTVARLRSLINVTDPGSKTVRKSRAA
jgi:hypothetical protein